MHGSTAQKIAAVEEVALIILFLVALCLPVLGMVLDLDITSLQSENRPLAPFPTVSLNQDVLSVFPEKFKLYFEDRFGFRNMLIRWQAVAKVKWLGVSSSQNVLIGKEGWLFYAAEGSLESYTGLEPFSEEQLARWQQMLEATRDWLAQRGVKYLFTIAPDKHTIYPEYLPQGIIRLRRESRLDQLISYLKQHSNLEILDLRPALYEAKSRHRIYYMTDTHWNGYGGFVAYRRIMEEVAKLLPGVKPLPEPAFEFVREQPSVRDLAKMLNLGDLFTEGLLTLRPRPEFAATIQSRESDRLMTSEQKDSRLPKLVMFRDSFATVLLQPLATHFSRAVYMWSHGIDLQLIESEHPDIVIQEMVERYLKGNPPIPPFEMFPP